jgi:L-arabinokinase
VRACTQHPIEEHRRVARFRDLLLAHSGNSAGAVEELGDLMHRSHVGYSTCGLGSQGTDRLVDLVRAAGPATGLYGAKITGGGSGGTVAVLARRGSRAAMDVVAAAYSRETRLAVATFTGSSSGSRAVGVRRLLPTGD